MEPPPELNSQFFDERVRRRSSNGNERSNYFPGTGLPDSVKSNLSKMVWDASQQQVRRAFSLYANIDLFRPYFDVEPKRVRNYLVLSLIPQKPSSMQKMTSDLYGPIMVLFTLVALLLYAMKSSQYQVQDGTLIGAAFFTCFGYWFFSSIAVYMLSYVFLSTATLIQTLSIMGYALFGHCVVLALTLFVDVFAHSHYLFYVLFVIFGGFSGLRLAIFFMSKTPKRKHRLIIGAAVLFLHTTFLLYLHFGYHEIVEESIFSLFLVRSSCLWKKRKKTLGIVAPPGVCPPMSLSNGIGPSASPAAMPSVAGRKVNLNVGGRKFCTTVSTLTRDPDSMLARMFSDDWRPVPAAPLQNADGKGSSLKSLTNFDSEPEHFIDRDGKHFRYVLNFLRDGLATSLPSENVPLLQELLLEAKFYQLQGLTELIKMQLSAPSRPLKTGEVVKWKADAVEYYWRPLAIALATEGIEFSFLFDKVGRKYNDKQTVAMCFGCAEKFLIDQITVFDYKIRFEEWEALKQHMRFVRGVVTRVVGDTCCVVEWPNRQTLHIPMTALVPATD